MLPQYKPLVWQEGMAKPLSLGKQARIQAGFALKQLQAGQSLGQPLSRPMPSIGPDCHALRIQDVGKVWQIIYQEDDDAIVIVGVFSTKSGKIPKSAVQAAKGNSADYACSSSNDLEKVTEEAWLEKLISESSVLLTPSQREEWIGDLFELLNDMQAQGLPKWRIRMNCLSELVFLCQAALWIKLRQQAKRIDTH